MGEIKAEGGSSFVTLSHVPHGYWLQRSLSLLAATIAVSLSMPVLGWSMSCARAGSVSRCPHQACGHTAYMRSIVRLCQSPLSSVQEAYAKPLEPHKATQVIRSSCSVRSLSLREVDQDSRPALDNVSPMFSPTHSTDITTSGINRADWKSNQIKWNHTGTAAFLRNVFSSKLGKWVTWIMEAVGRSLIRHAPTDG